MLSTRSGYLPRWYSIQLDKYRLLKFVIWSDTFEAVLLEKKMAENVGAWFVVVNKYFVKKLRQSWKSQFKWLGRHFPYYNFSGKFSLSSFQYVDMF